MSAGRVAGGWRSHPGPRKTAPRAHFWCRNLAPKLGPLFGPRVNKIQAHAVWQWYNFCAARVPSGKAPLRINVDETPVCLFQGGGKGTIVFNKRKDPPAMEPHENASRAKRRACLTHVAFICDRPDIQPLLPQVLIGNETTFPKSAFAALQAASPGNVHLVRQKSAWNNKNLMTRIITILALALRHCAHLQPILLLDACRVHIPAIVLQRCVANSIWPIIVPAKLTWLLQPCDTHAFQKYKVYLRKAYQTARAGAASHELGVAEFLACIYSAIRYVLQGNVWGTAFDADGFGHNQGRLSMYIQRQLQTTGPLSLPASVPSEELLKHCFPRRATVPHRTLMRPFQPVPSPAALPKAPSGVRLALGPRVPAASLAIVEPPAMLVAPGREPRTRSEHRLAAAAASPAIVEPPAMLVAPGREPRTRSEHRLAAALAMGRPLPK